MQELTNTINMARSSASQTHSPFSFSLVLAFSLLSSFYCAGVQSVGVCYGMDGNNLPPAAEVVQLLKQRNIRSVRLYYPNSEALKALRRSNITVMLGVPNDRLRDLAADAGAAKTWVQVNIKSYSPEVHFKYIAVGNEQIPNGNAQSVLPAMENIYNALVSAGLSRQIKVSTAVDTGVLGVSYPPSAGAFSAAASRHMAPIVHFLSKTGAPLLANVYPYFAHKANPGSITLPYALFTSPPPTNGNKYQNLFDAQVDALISAIQKVSAAQPAVVVSESGWPSAGSPAATVNNARTYNQNLIRHVSNGTPSRPGQSIETFVFALFNENRKNSGEEQNFGLFHPNKQPVYPITF